MVLVQKWPFFRPFFLSNLERENVLYHILERKNSFLGFKNKKFKKLINWHFSQGVNPWFWSKNGHFFNFSFLSDLGRENVFYDILERKKAFLGYKNKKNKKSKKCAFFFFLFSQFRPGKCLLRYSRTKKHFSTL